MTKRIIAFLLTAVLSISCFPIWAFAADTVATEPAKEATISVESASCIVGKEIEIDVSIMNNPGIAGSKFTISYDEGLTLISATEEGGAFEALDYTPPYALNSPCSFNWDSLDAVANGDGTILTLKFAISDTAKGGDRLNVKIACVDGDTYDFNLNTVKVNAVSGVLEVIDYVPGDADGDGTVNGKDVTVIRRYNAGWDIDINLLAADVNADGAANGKDVTLIRRYSANWPGIELLPGFKELKPDDPTAPDISGPVVDEEFEGEIKKYDTELRVLSRVNDNPTGWGNYDIVYDEDSWLVVTEIKEAIKKRNDKLEEDMGVTINQIAASNVYNSAYPDLYMNRDQYDLILPSVADAGKLAAQGLLLSTEDLVNMNTEKGYYDQRALDRLAINGENYFFFSDITVVDRDAIWVYYFNENLIDAYNLENPYNLVSDYEWTLGKLIEMCEVATYDADGTPDKNDNWGIAGHDYIITSLYHGTGEMIAGSDETGAISITINTPRVLEFIEAANMLRDYWARYQIFITGFANDTSPYGFAPGDNYAQLMETFAAGRVLFMGEVLAARRDILDAATYGDLSIGILPTPMLNEEQGEYFTPVNTIAACTAVPYTVGDRAEDLSNIIEYWASLSHGTVRKAYVEQLQKTRLSKDEIPAEIVNIILGAASYDLGATCAWGNLVRELTAIVWDGRNDFAAMYDRCGAAAKAALNEFMDYFAEDGSDEPDTGSYELEVNGTKMNFADLHSEGTNLPLFTEATEDVTIKLLKDIDLTLSSYYFPLYSNNLKADGTPVKFIFDGNGYTITTDAANFFRLGGAVANPTATNNVTIKNLTVNYSGIGPVIQIYSGGEFLIKNVKINCTGAVNWTVIHANMGDNTGNPANVTLNNVEIHMSPNATRSSSYTTSMIRTGNPYLRDTDGDGKYDLDTSPIVNLVLNNCLLSAPGTPDLVDGADVPGVRGIYVTSSRARVVVNNSTIITPNSCIYGDSHYFPENDRVDDAIIPGEDWVILNECTLDNSGKNTACKDEAVYVGGLATVIPELPELDTDIVAEIYLAGTDTPAIQVMRKDFTANFANAGGDLLSSDPRVAGADVTIEILRDINIGSNQCRIWATLGKTIVVNGNGHKIEAETAGNPAFRFNSGTGGGAVIINDLDIHNTNGYFLSYYNGVKVTLNGCDCVSDNHMGAYLTGFGTLNLVGSTFTTGSHTINGMTGNTNGNFINIDEDSALICTGAGRTINLQNAEFTRVNIEGTVMHVGDDGVAVYQNDGLMTNIVTVSGKTIEQAIPVGAIQGITVVTK